MSPLRRGDLCESAGEATQSESSQQTNPECESAVEVSPQQEQWREPPVPARDHQLRANTDQEQTDHVWSWRPRDAHRAKGQTDQGESKDHGAAHERPGDSHTRRRESDGEEREQGQAADGVDGVKDRFAQPLVIHPVTAGRGV